MAQERLSIAAIRQTGYFGSMIEILHPALLPPGLRDVLPPDAQIEAEVIHRLTGILAANGYERVAPPLLEFETSLLGGSGAAMAPHTFRLMDPISQHMIGLRADMTLQIARIATTRLVKQPRPLRLSYSGDVLRVSGSQLRQQRQFAQVGAELIGSSAPSADAEVIILAAEALLALGVNGLSVDLTMPVLVPVILRRLGADEAVAAAAREALDHKDAASIAALGGETAAILGRLMHAAGPAAACMTQVSSLALPDEAAAELDRLRTVLTLVQAALPTLSLTIDPVENRGFEYHTGVSFSLFARGTRGELGRGGRYLAQVGEHPEPATGFTLYMDTVIHAVPAPDARPRVFLACETPRSAAAACQTQGFATVFGLEPVADPRQEAARLGCSHVLLDGAVIDLT
jgi:ATP phosphoribosyltransferase regulatory subunit